MHRARAEAITDFLQRAGIFAGAESIVQGLVVNVSLLQLAFGPLMTVQPEPDGKRCVSVGFPERSVPRRYEAPSLPSSGATYNVTGQ